MFKAPISCLDDPRHKSFQEYLTDSTVSAGDHAVQITTKEVRRSFLKDFFGFSTPASRVKDLP